MVHNESEIRTSKGVVTRCHLDAVDSTNSYAMQLLRSKPEMFTSGQGVLVTTDKQSEGRGSAGMFGLILLERTLPCRGS